MTCAGNYKIKPDVHSAESQHSCPLGSSNCTQQGSFIMPENEICVPHDRFDAKGGNNWAKLGSKPGGCGHSNGLVLLALLHCHQVTLFPLEVQWLVQLCCIQTYPRTV